MKKHPPNLILASAGSYPRTGAAPEMLELDSTVKAYECGDRTTADLVDAQNAMARRAISEQVAAGLDIITDGLVRWIDPVSHFMRGLDNVHLDGLHPFFGTSHKYRQPVLTGRPVRHGCLLAHEYSFARNALGHLPTPKGKAGKLSIKPVLTGPYTLAKLSSTDSKTRKTTDNFSSLEHRVEAFADVLGGEIKILIEAGADLIQIDEPAAAAHPKDFSLVAAGLAALLAVRDSVPVQSRRPALAAYFYFGDCTPLHKKLQELPVDLLGLDFASSPKLPEAVESIGSSKPLALGFVCGSTPELENAEVLARRIERLLPHLPDSRAHLGTSCGLGFLSHDDACAKLALLAKIQKLVLG
jgi:5-methyltetrahydropteroyltriglutamate--homocysteine methyltransferase